MPVARETREFDDGEDRYGAEHYVDSALLASIASGGTCPTFLSAWRSLARRSASCRAALQPVFRPFAAARLVPFLF